MSGTYAGKNVFALFGIESTFNTPVSTTKDIGVISGISPDLNNNNIQVRSIGDREVCANVAGNFDATLGIDGTLNSGAVFELMFGQSTDTETTGDYTHTFVDRGTLELLNTASSFTMSENYDSTTDVVNTYSGCKINSLEVSVETGGTLNFSAEVLASSLAVTSSAGTEVLTSTSKLAGFNATLSTGDAGSEATVGLTKNVSVSFGQNIDPADVKAIGSRENQDLVEKNMDVTVTFTKSFANSTEEQRFLGGTSPSTGTPTATSLILSVNNGVALGSGRVEFYVKLSGGQYESTNRTVSTDGIVEETFNYTFGNIEDVYFVDAVASYF